MQKEQCIQNIAKLFQETYPGRGGQIGRHELLRFLGLVTRGAVTDASLERVVDIADKDGSGLVDVMDFLTWLFGQAKPGSGEDANRWAMGDHCRCSLGTPQVGVGSVYLAELAAEVPHVDQLAETSEPAFDDTIDRFREVNAGDEVLQAMLLNKVKVCPGCKKECAYTLRNCNGCNSSIVDVKMSTSDNIFMGFIFGIARGRYAYKISMRAQTPDFLCFDDPLSCTVCHVNAIPTYTYIPDARYLFTDPARGLALIDRLFEVAADVALGQFWSDMAFRNKFLKGHPTPESRDDVYKMAFCGFNYPPSMYQLHLQFMHPPLLPFHFNLALEEKHFSHGRFFPLEYVRAALALGDAVKMEITDDTDTGDIISMVTKQGINYDEYHSTLMRRVRRMQAAFSPWEEQDFRHQVINGKVFSSFGGLVPVPQKDPLQIQKEDKMALQNYGRPYDADGKPTGTHYRYPKRPGEVSCFVRPAAS